MVGVVNRRRVLRAFLFILIVLTLFFIWSNSAKDADSSTEDSDSVILIVKPLIDPEGRIPLGVFERIVRKAAHFSEFALLGAEFFFFLLTKAPERRKKHLCISLSLTVLCAVTDECIQLTASGRSASVFDVLLDTLGGAFGILAALLIWVAVNSLKRKKRI